MGKATNRKTKTRADAAGNVHSLIVQADIPARQREINSYEIVQVANPYGEVMVRGEVRTHKSVRIKPAFREMYERRSFDRARVPAKQIMAALEWYDDRLDLAQSGMIKCGLDVSGAGGSAAGSRIPVTEAAMWARSDVAWVRGLVPAHLRAAFDAVMVDGERFVETARRLHANRYVRVSVERARRNLAGQFIEAATLFAEEWEMRFVPQSDGRIRT
jgi:hypothetical protein